MRLMRLISLGRGNYGDAALSGGAMFRLSVGAQGLQKCVTG